jgi:hypothetical protein
MEDKGQKEILPGLLTKLNSGRKEDKYGFLDRYQEGEVERCWKDTKPRKESRCKVSIQAYEWNNAVNFTIQYLQYKRNILLVSM